MKCNLKLFLQRKPIWVFVGAVLSVFLLSSCSSSGGGDDETPINTGGDISHEGQPTPPTEYPPAVKDGPKYDLATYPEAGGDQVNRHGTWIAVGSYTLNGITYRARQVLRIKPFTEPLVDTLEMCSSAFDGVVGGVISSNDTLFSLPGHEFTVISTTDMVIAVHFDEEGYQFSGELRAHKVSSNPDIAVGVINLTATTDDFDAEAVGPVLVQMFDNESFPVHCFGEAESDEPGGSIFEIFGVLIPGAPTIAVARRHMMEVQFDNHAMSVTSEEFVAPDGQPQGHKFSLEKDVDDNDDNDLTRNEFFLFAAMEGMSIDNLWDQQQRYQSAFHMQQLDYLENGNPATAGGEFVLDAFFGMTGNQEM